MKIAAPPQQNSHTNPIPHSLPMSHPLPIPHSLLTPEHGYKTLPIEISPGLTVGGVRLVVMAGPCSIESSEMLNDCGNSVKNLGARVLRGGAFKPRTSPYDFQGLGDDGIEILRAAKRELQMPVITEVMDVRKVEAVSQVADIIQVGARNMQNYPLLIELGSCGRPILLKRGPSARIKELILAAEYIMKSGNEKVILCERGIRTFEDAMRNTLDISSVPVLKSETHLPVIIDPSHAAGNSGYVLPLAMAGIAAGADGLLVEVHPDPEHALSDADQQLTYDQFAVLMKKITMMAIAMERSI